MNSNPDQYPVLSSETIEASKDREVKPSTDSLT